MATAITVGDVIRCSVTFYSDTAKTISADPAAVSFKYRIENGTVTTYVYGTDAELVKDDTGDYHVDLTLAAAGLYEYSWHGVGTVTITDESKFRVRALQTA